MKRIINGVSYNTETSTEIAKYEYDTDEGEPAFETLYQMRGGAFFTQAYQRTITFDETAPGGRIVREINTFHPMSRDEAQDWIMTGNVEVFSDIFGELLRGDRGGQHRESTIYVSSPDLPEGSDRRLRRTRAGQSVNAWAIRCLESGASASA